MLLFVSTLPSWVFLCRKVTLCVGVFALASSRVFPSSNINMGYVSADADTACGRQKVN